MPIGIVVERYETGNVWAPERWLPVAAIAPAPPAASWKVLEQAPGRVRYHAGNVALELFARETQGYVANLAQDPSRVYVVLTPSEDETEPGPQDGDASDGGSPRPVDVLLATLCPFEAMSYAESGDEVVEGVPMPAVVRAWVAAFVADHHVDLPFRKRRNRAAGERGLGSRPRGRFGGPSR